MKERIRVLRVLEYVGDRDWVEMTLKQNHVKGEFYAGNGNIIREALVGIFPERLPMLEGGEAGIELKPFVVKVPLSELEDDA